MQQAILPKKFIERNAKLFGRENSEFLKSCEIKLQKTIRVNTLKNSVPEFLSAFEGKAELEKVPFCDYAFRVKKGPERLGFTLEHVVGKFIVQETSSLLPSLALNPGHGETVLDMCAAPGAKTTHLAQLMQNSGTIVALDLNKPRLEGLQFNLERLGVTNACVLFQDALQFRSRKLFDKILLDAPCSSEGEIRKDWKALSAWSETLIHSKSELQKKLIEKAFSLLRPEGEMVYSTCTLAPEE
ncbi:MAG: RsmB/NOP family class I SAM-dependent RNA methyltransferase, partial [Candidatus Diapherotrites archaeon]|nr:RsmB/NOP family class I SAM-dependent RNA methyltransferase [Candidatus Diapherotrites archaeon]